MIDFKSGDVAATSFSACTCQVPLNQGLPCKHMLRLFDLKKVTKIPEKLIHPMWLVDDDQVVQAEKALRVAELGTTQGRRRTTQVDVGQVCKAQRDYNFSQLLSKMKSLAVNSVKAHDAIQEIYSRAYAEAQRVVRSMRPPPRERPTQPTQNTTQPVLIDDDVDDKPEAIDDDTSDEVKVAEEMLQEPMSNPENFASGSGNRKMARYKTRGRK